MRNPLVPPSSGQRLIALVAINVPFLEAVLEHAKNLLFSSDVPSPDMAARMRAFSFVVAYAGLVHRQPALSRRPSDGMLQSCRSSEWPSVMMSSANTDLQQPPVPPLQVIGLQDGGDDVLLDCLGSEGAGSIIDLPRLEEASNVSGAHEAPRSRRSMTRSAALQVRRPSYYTSAPPNSQRFTGECIRVLLSCIHHRGNQSAFFFVVIMMKHCQLDFGEKVPGLLDSWATLIADAFELHESEVASVINCGQSLAAITIKVQ
jgi:hypothetical protein